MGLDSPDLVPPAQFSNCSSLMTCLLCGPRKCLPWSVIFGNLVSINENLHPCSMFMAFKNVCSIQRHEMQRFT